MSYKVNKKVLMDKLGFDEEDLIILFSVFLKSSKENLEKLRIAIDANDFHTIYICSHSLKGSSGNLMIDEVYSLTKDIESASKDAKIFNYKSYYDKLVTIFDKLNLH